jgi:hypothetical protein
MAKMEEGHGLSSHARGQAEVTPHVRLRCFGFGVFAPGPGHGAAPARKRPSAPASGGW